MKYLRVNLWGKEIGRLVWESDTRRAYFMYNPETISTIPDISPLLSPAANRNSLFPIYSDDRPIYQNLPPFIADSLPDSWGNTLFDKWIKNNKIPRNKVTPLYKLMFIGTRGMGALEYEPCASDLTHIRKIDIKSLYDISLKILEDRGNITLNTNEELTLQALLAVGTSAGGRQMKAIIAINSETGEIRSGQTDRLKGFEYYILKFGNSSIPIAEIETAFHNMAKHAGIEMEECRLFPVEGINHFLTKRFDRRMGEKIHMQTLAAINPEARSYEDLVATCRELSIPESGIEQIFCRMVFNVMANNTDDHTKNFAFLLEKKGRWRLSPAYDMTFTFNTNATGPNAERRLSICGKTSGISKSDLLDFARQNDIRNANATINKVADAIKHFDRHADECSINQPWRSIIQTHLNDTLANFGYSCEQRTPDEQFSDKYGRTFSDISISVNSKGHYEVSAIIDGNRRRRFIRPNMTLYAELSRQKSLDLHNLNMPYIIGQLFPPD
ncbi:MAG: type II toxin-antitoxin system HipA family toxin [Muribaculaceae bacterium]|nr:type II toxin-antitoxin system HipA family toxin [Muribaculaceae bacterium]